MASVRMVNKNSRSHHACGLRKGANTNFNGAQRALSPSRLFIFVQYRGEQRLTLKNTGFPAFLSREKNCEKNYGPTYGPFSGHGSLESALCTAFFWANWTFASSWEMSTKRCC